MTDQDAARLRWLKDNPTKTYNDLPQGLWDDGRIAAEVARQNDPLQGFQRGENLNDNRVWPLWPL